MRRNRSLTILLILAMGLLSTPAGAKYYKRAGGGHKNNDSYHFGYINGGVGYTSLDCGVPDLKVTGSVGGFVGIGYEFRNNGFWLSVGPQLGFHRSEVSMDQYTEDRRGYDTQGKSITLHYTINERDQQEWQFIEIPVLIGWYFHGFHIGAGPKLSYSINSTVTASGQYEVSATNDLYGIEFKDMPEHGYTTYDFSCKHQATLRPAISLVGEIGYDVLSSVPTRSQLCHILRVSFYFEYGLSNMVVPSSSNTRISVNPQDATQVDVYPYFASGMTESYRVVPYFTGVKITYLLGGSKHARAGGFHKGCQCYN